MEVMKNYIYKSCGGRNWSSIKWQLVTMCVDICISRIKYRNLPPEIPFYIPELELFGSGQTVFAERGGVPFWLPSVLRDGPNFYGLPFEVDGISMTGTEPIISGIRVLNVGRDLKDVKPINGVEILNDVTRTATLAKVMPYIDRIDYLWTTMGMNQALSRVQLVATCSKNQYDVFKRELSRLLDKKNPITLIRDKSQLGGIEVQDFKVEYMCDRYWYDLDKTFTQLFTALGVKTNFASQKKERLITAEVDANDEVITWLRDSYIRFREEGINSINKLYGYNIDVDIEMKPITLGENMQELLPEDKEQKESPAK